jgi:hypothetical protein
MLHHSLKHAVEIGFTPTYQPSPTQVAPGKFCSWRKVEEAKTMSWCFSLKVLKSLALPRGIEPLFQP